MNNTELEKYSAPSFLEILEVENIEYVVFDLDGTLLKTDEHFHELLTNLGIDISLSSNLLDPNYFLCLEMARQLEKQTYQIYYDNNRQPTLIDEQYEQALLKYFEYLGVGEITEEMRNIIKDYAYECYVNSPQEYQDVIELLKSIKDSGRGILFHSHAQEDWTRIKTEYLCFSTGIKDIKYLATPITQKKDKESWEKAFNMTGKEPLNIMVIGDNFEADILPAIEAGCRNVVWINRLNKKISEEYKLPKDINLHIVQDISEVKDLSHNLLVNI